MILAEQLLLLFLDDEKGDEKAGWGADPGLAGALLLDLTRLDAVEDVDGKLVAADAPRLDHPVLIDAHAAISADAKRRDAKGWVDRLPSALKPLKNRIAAGLVETGVLSEERHRMLGLFKTTRFPEADPGPERELRERLRAILLGERQPTPEGAMLIALLRPYDVPQKLVPKDRRKDAKRRAEEVAEGGVAAAAVASALQQVQAAILASVTISAATVTVTTSS